MSGAATAEAAASTHDQELQAALARDALAGLDRLLAFVPRGEAIAGEQIGALVRLIGQAAVAGAG